MNYISSAFLIISLLWYIFYILIIVRLYFVSSRPYPYDNNVDVSNLNLTLEDLSLIMYKKIKPEVLTASIVRMINNGKIKLDRVGNEIILINASDGQELTKLEFNIIELLFSLIGSDKKVTISQIHNYCNNNAGSSTFLMNYEIWKKMAFVNSNRSIIFEPKLDYNVVKWIQRLGYIIFVLNIIFKFNLIMDYFMIVPAIFISVYFYKISKLTKTYSDYYYGFLHFRFDIKNNPDLLENNQYLEYSIILKCFDNIANDNKIEVIGKLDRAIKRCYTNAILKGNRSLFGK